MKQWTWQSVVVFGIVVAAVVILYALTDDVAARAELLGYMDAIVPFVVGAAAGAAIGGTAGYLKGKEK